MKISITTDEGEVLDMLTATPDTDGFADLPTDAEILSDTAPLSLEEHYSFASRYPRIHYSHYAPPPGV